MGILDTVFGSVFGWAVLLGPVYAISIISATVSLLFAVLNRFLVDIDELKMIKKKLKHMQKEAKKFQKEKNDKKLKELMSDQLKYSNRMMKMNMKPLLISLLVVFPLLPWISSTFESVVFALPFWLPFAGTEATWLGLYILVSLPTTFLFRKVLGVD